MSNSAWAVYQVTIQGQPGPMAVCPQAEWDAIEKSSPGLHRLVQGGIANEGTAERLARGTSGDDRIRLKKLPIAEPLDPEPDIIVDAEESPGSVDAGPTLLPFPLDGTDSGERLAPGEHSTRLGRSVDGEVA